MHESSGFSIIKILIRVSAFLIASAILVHLFSIFGVFLAIALPFWWFLAPKSTPCFFCRLTKVGHVCPACKQVLYSRKDSYPKDIRSVIFNALVIFGLSLVSLAVVYGETLILEEMGVSFTQKTTSFKIPAKGQYRLGEIFPMKIEIVGIKTPINVVQADLSFNPDKLEVSHINTQGSFANIFIQKEINNELGFARLTGGLPNPGFSEEYGLFGVVYFRAKQAGIANIEFLPSSMVLANDGKGTNILYKFEKVSYLILPDELTAEEKKMQQDLVSMTEDILGVQHEAGQLILYGDEQVLGVQDMAIKEMMEAKNKDNSFFTPLLSKLDKFLNETILILGKKTIYNFTPIFVVVILGLCVGTKLCRRNK